jgi:hypothetical protein
MTEREMTLQEKYMALDDQVLKLREGLKTLIACHDRPHGFDDSHWYAHALEIARKALRDTDEIP